MLLLNRAINANLVVTSPRSSGTMPYYELSSDCKSRFLQEVNGGGAQWLGEAFIIVKDAQDIFTLQSAFMFQIIQMIDMIKFNE